MRFETSEHAYLLWLMILLPLIPIISFLLYKKRLWLSTLFRLLVCACLILALADMQWVQETKETDVLLVVDQSDSLGMDGKQRVWQFARTLAARDYGHLAEHRIGAVVFGKAPSLEHPLSASASLGEAPETAVDGTQSNIASALKFAGSLFDRTANRRIVLITDGETTDQAVVEVSHQLSDQGIEIDVARIPLDSTQDIVVESVDVPARAGMNSPVHFSVRLRKRNGDPSLSNSGRLLIQRIQGNQRQTIADGPVELKKDYEIVPMLDNLQHGGLVVYEAKFVPEAPESDAYLQNNVASGICEVTDQGKVLVITTSDQVSDVEKRLRFLNSHGIDFEVRSDAESFSTLADLLGYDTVLMVNAPRMQTVDELPVLRYTDEQLADLNKYVHDFGGGLMMTGGPNGLGAGSWMNTPVEEAMPVRFQVDNEKLVSIGALALVIDKSGSMQGDKIAMSQSAAIAALSMLSDTDYIGIYPFDSELSQPISLQKISGNREAFRRKIRRIGAAGGTNMTPALNQAYRDLRKSSATLKHVVLLTDGQTHGSDFARQAAEMQRHGITTSAVSVGSDADRKLLMSIAQQGGGRFYQVDKSSAIPRIFMKETRMLARPLIQEFEEGVGAATHRGHEITQGLPQSLPTVRGIVLSTLRENVLSEQLIQANQPEAPNNTLLASWQFGSGRSAVWTSDLGERWAHAWSDSGSLDQLLVQSLRWLKKNQLKHNHFVRVVTESSMTRITLQWDDSVPEIPVSMQCIVAGIGTTERHQLSFQRLGPRQFEATVDNLVAGNYALAIDGGEGTGVITQGFSVQDTREFEQHPESIQSLVSIASLGLSERPATALSPTESIAFLESRERWIPIPSARARNGSRTSKEVAEVNLFRNTSTKERKLSSTWPLFVLASSVFFLAELAIRKFGLDRLLSPSMRNANALPRTQTNFPTNSGRRKPSVAPEATTGLAPEESLSYTERLLKTKNKRVEQNSVR